MVAAVDRPSPKSDKSPRFEHSDALLVAVLEHAAEGVLVLTADSRMVYANPAFRQMLGYAPGDLERVHASNLAHPDDAGAAQQKISDLLGGVSGPYQAERRYRHRDGSYVWVRSSVSLFRNPETDEPQYIVIQITNLDAQKRAEEELSASESRWNFALETAGQGVWDHRLSQGKVFYSRMWRLMRGISADEEIDGATEVWLARVHPDDRERIRRTVNDQDAGIIPRNDFEYRERHRDGHYLWILSRGGPVEWDASGKPIRFLGTDTDITALKAVETALAVEKEKLRVTLESIGDGVISADAHGIVTFMNPMAEEMTGWAAVQAIGKPIGEVFVVVDEATGEKVRDPVGEALKGERQYYLDEDAVLVTRMGERRAVRDSAAPVRTPDGELLGAVLVFQDVTRARELQRALTHSAMHDSLTGLANRGAFERALAEAIEQARRESREHALCFVDLDRFKIVNDTAGHAAGDALLRQIAHALRRACRSQDFAARIGGDEFAVLLADCSVAGARRAGEQIIDAISSIRFTWAGRTYAVGASVGITSITSRSGNVGELMNEADAACYAAKSAGRNRVMAYDPTLHGPERFAASA